MAEPIIIAHRGASKDAPENTLAAFREAWAQGADAIEADFRLTVDGAIVCIHDPVTDRVSSKSLVVAESTLAGLRSLDVGEWKGRSFRGERVPTMGEVLALVPPGKGIVMEIKCGLEIMPALDRVLAESTLSPEQIAIISFNDHFIQLFKQRHPRIAARWLAYVSLDEYGEFVPGVPELVRTLSRCHADGLGASAHPGVTAAFVDGIRAAGHEFHVWTVDDLAEARRFRAFGVQSITTNEPGKIRAGLAMAM